MSQRPISHSDDLRRLREEGFEIEIRAAHLVVHSIPYLDANRVVRRGTLVTELSLAGDVTQRPGSHVAMLAGDTPHDANGVALRHLIGSNHQDLGDGVSYDHMFSSKPQPSGAYGDYYEKITAYVALIAGPAEAVDPTSTARTFAVVAAETEDSPFLYEDTATGRAQIGAIAERLALACVAIVGLGGTGSYILDLVAKTKVKEIHLYDFDRFLQHNAFRTPGAPSAEQLAGAPNKVDYLTGQYSKMRRGVIAHRDGINASNVGELGDMDFVFVAVDNGAAKELIVRHLDGAGIPFVEVGMGIDETDGQLGGMVRLVAGMSGAPVADSRRIPFDVGEADNEYDRNIQIADLNALNAALAVIKWKKMFGFYRDLDHEQFTTYTVDGNHLLNERDK